MERGWGEANFMRNIFLPILLLLTTQYCLAQQPNSPANVIDPWDIHIEFEPILGETAPGLHSFAYTTYGSKWVFIGGRTNGMHGQNSNSNFEMEFANSNIVVLDTVDWQWSSASLSQLPLPVADPLRSTNMQYWADSTTLYMIGGYGWDSTLSAYTTYPTLSAIDVPGLITAVEMGDSIYPHIRQYSDTNLAVCGGELIKMDSLYYLIMGHKFEGRYSTPAQMLFTQRYTNAIRHFTIVDDGDTLYIANFDELVDTNNFHRRDLNAVRLDYGDTSKIAVLGGVFQKDHNLPFTRTVLFDGQSAYTEADTFYTQRFNQYTNAHILIKGNDYWGSGGNNAYGIIMLGGMGTYNYDPFSYTKYDSLVPFSQTISMVKINQQQALGDADGYIGPYSLGLMPGYLGSNAVFIKGGGFTPTSNGAILMEELPDFEPDPRKFVGYLFGGIRGTAANNAVSSANDTIYRIYYRCLSGASINELPGISLKNIYPNPGNGTATLALTLDKPQKIKATLYNINGIEVQPIYNGSLSSGAQNIPVNAAGLPSGIYLVKIEAAGGTGFLKYAVIK